MNFKLFFLFLSSTSCSLPHPHSLDRGNCPEGWLDGHFVDMGCLQFFTGDADAGFEGDQYNMAQWGCASLGDGGALVEILTEEQFDFVVMGIQLIDSQTSNHTWWVGGTDLGRDGKWIWLPSLGNVSSFGWAEGQPDEGPNASCLAMSPERGYKWSDENCIDSAFFPICQVK